MGRKVREATLCAGSVAWRVFCDTCVDAADSIDRLGYSRRRYEILDDEDAYGRAQLKERQAKRRALQRLQQQALIRVEKQGGRMFAVLTQAGRQQQLRHTILQKTKQLPEGKLCLVSFDIPEHVSHLRHMFRSLLRDAGFKQVHKSVWEGKRDVVDELHALIHEMDAKDWIRVYLVHPTT